MASLSMLGILVINFTVTLFPEMSLPMMIPITTMGISFTILIAGIIQDFLVGYTKEQRRKVAAAAARGRAKSRAKGPAPPTPAVTITSGS